MSRQERVAIIESMPWNHADSVLCLCGWRFCLSICTGNHGVSGRNAM